MGENFNIRGFTSDVISDINENFYFLSTDSGDFRVTKLDSNTNEVWSKKYETPKENFHGIIALDTEGNIFISGNSAENIRDHETWELVTMKLTANGDILWSDTSITNGSDMAYASTTDRNGNLFIVGSLRKTSADSNAFITKYASNGTREWSKNITTRYYTHAGSISIDENDDIYVCGITGRDLFFAKYSTSGEQTHHEVFKTIDDVRAPSMTLSKDGYIYIGGLMEFKDDKGKNLKENGKALFVKKLNKNGKEKYFKTFETTSDEIAIHNLEGDVHGNLYLYGERLAKTANNHNKTLFLTQLNPDGNVMYEKEYNGSSYLSNLGKHSELYIDKNNSIFIAANGHIKLKGDELALGDFILKLKVAP